MPPDGCSCPAGKAHVYMDFAYMDFAYTYMDLADISPQLTIA